MDFFSPFYCKLKKLCMRVFWLMFAKTHTGIPLAPAGPGAPEGPCAPCERKTK